ncbi:pitrilysin family protein [Synechococcus sp. CBW1107]|uniref:M16 family metallopeptidase n=1 Tax=Synechococcus sp. CBW1107 TaxID=2789857 RepID=UPI002AD42D58|nr:pitrilysin family protein [Synechococcus sp. CBW1107]
MPVAVPQGASPLLLPELAPPQLDHLANGAPVVSLSLPDAPLICLNLWCRAGSAWEAPQESGVAHFLEHMVFKGSAHLEAGEFDRRIEALGGSSNAATGFDDVHYHVLIPPDAADQALDLLLDLVLRPRLEEEAFAMERQVVLEELAQSEDQPEEIAMQRLLALACPDHPYGLPILGRRDALLQHTPAVMGEFQRRLYGADRCILALSGCLETGPLAADQRFDRLSGSALAELDASSDPPSPPALRLRPGVHRLAIPRLEAARLLMAWALPAAVEQEAVMGADLLTTALAEGRRSRLVDRLREDLRIVESVDLDLHVLECGSLALLEAVCEPEDLPEVRRVIAQVWQELGETALPEAEWQRSRRLVAHAYRFGLEAAGGVAGLIGANGLWGRHAPLEQPLQLLEAWSPARLQRSMLPLFDPALACVLEAVPA